MCFILAFPHGSGVRNAPRIFSAGARLGRPCHFSAAAAANSLKKAGKGAPPCFRRRLIISPYYQGTLNREPLKRSYYAQQT